MESGDLRREGPASTDRPVFTIAGAIVMTWMYNRTGGNLLLPALMHASGNASLPLFESLFPGLDNELTFPLLVFGVWAVVAVLLVLKVGTGGLDPRPRCAGSGARWREHRRRPNEERRL